MTTERKILIGLAVALLGLLATLGAGYHYHSETLSALTATAKSAATNEQTYRLQAEGLAMQVNGLKVEVQKRDEALRLATHTAKYKRTIKDGDKESIEEGETSDLLQESDRHFLQMAADQLTQLQARVTRSELAAQTATATAESLQQRLDKQTIDLQKSAPRWEAAIDVAPRVLGWDPFGTPVDNPKLRATGSMLIGPYAIGVNFAPAFAFDKLDPLLHAAIRF